MKEESLKESASFAQNTIDWLDLNDVKARSDRARKRFDVICKNPARKEYLHQNPFEALLLFESFMRDQGESRSECNNIGVSPPRQLIASTAGQPEIGERKPPNIRFVQNCASCSHSDYGERLTATFRCRKYQTRVAVNYFCDDYE